MTLTFEPETKIYKGWRNWVNGVISHNSKSVQLPPPPNEGDSTANDLYRQALDLMPGLFYMVNWVDKRMVFANQVALNFYGLHSDHGEVLNFTLIESAIHPDDQEAYKSARRCLRSAPQGDTVEAEIRCRNYQDQWCWLHYTAKVISKTVDGFPEIVLWYGQDVTGRKQAEERLVFASYHDILTGLYNRAYFEEELSKLEGGRNFPLGVLMVDIDNMKQTNDRLGHSAGDELICRTATILKMVFRREDIIARIGGDEFAVLLPKTDRTQAVKGLSRVRLEMQKVNNSPGRNPLSLSIGMAVATYDSDLRLVLKRADEAMYQEKSRHGGRGIPLKTEGEG